jgi:hypothetical protein
MNVAIGALGAHLTLGLVSGLTSAINGVFTLSNNISTSTNTGAINVRHMIRDTDLEFKIKAVQIMLFELKINDSTTYSVKYCIASIKEIIDEISEELIKIHYRLQYNDTIWFGPSVRAYSFHNCINRLKTCLINLDTRCKTLKDMVLLESNTKLVKNIALEEFLADDLLQINDIDPKAVMVSKQELYNKLEYITTIPYVDDDKPTEKKQIKN